MSARLPRRLARVALVAAVQLTLVVVAVAPRLSALVGGEEYRLRVAAFDPIDPLRGAYVQLDYPDVLPRRDSQRHGEGDVYVPLVRDGDVWRGSGWSRTRPDDAPYLTCTSRDWEVRCGIESWFADQEEARVVGEGLARNGGVATVRVDGRGHAVLVGLEAG